MWPCDPVAAAVAERAEFHIRRESKSAVAATVAAAMSVEVSRCSLTPCSLRLVRAWLQRRLNLTYDDVLLNCAFDVNWRRYVKGATTTLSDVAMAAAGAGGMVDGSAIDAAGLSSGGGGSGGSSLGKGRGKAKANSFALTWKGGLALEAAAAEATAVTFAAGAYTRSLLSST